MSHRVVVWALRTLTVLAIVGAWLYANRPGGVPRFLLPSLPGVIGEFFTLLRSRLLWDDVVRTLTEVLIAGGIAISAGLLFGFAMARTALRAAVVEPLLAWGYMAPLILFYPVFILWFGVGIWSKVAYAALSAFFPIAFNALRAFRSIDPRFLRVGRAFGASSGQIDRMIKFRAALPVVAAGIRIGTAATLITVIVAEQLASTKGLGHLVAESSQTFAIQLSFAAILVVLVLVALLQALVNRALPTSYAPTRGTKRPSGVAR